MVAPRYSGAAARACRRRGSDQRRPGRQRKVGEGLGRGHPAAGGAVEQAGREQERLVDVLDGVGLLGHRDRERVEADRAAGERDAECLEDRAVDLVEPEFVDFEEDEGVTSDAMCDSAVGSNLGVVANALEEPIGDPRRAPRPACDLRGGVGLERHPEDACGALHDRDEVGGVVVVEARRRSRSDRAAGR